jgi:hypothetical protein
MVATGLGVAEAVDSPGAGNGLPTLQAIRLLVPLIGKAA